MSRRGINNAIPGTYLVPGIFLYTVVYSIGVATV